MYIARDQHRDGWAVLELFLAIRDLHLKCMLALRKTFTSMMCVYPSK